MPRAAAVGPHAILYHGLRRDLRLSVRRQPLGRSFHTGVASGLCGSILVRPELEGSVTVDLIAPLHRDVLFAAPPQQVRNTWLVSADESGVDGQEFYGFGPSGRRGIGAATSTGTSWRSGGGTEWSTTTRSSGARSMATCEPLSPSS